MRVISSSAINVSTWISYIYVSEIRAFNVSYWLDQRYFDNIVIVTYVRAIIYLKIPFSSSYLPTYTPIDLECTYYVHQLCSFECDPMQFHGQTVSRTNLSYICVWVETENELFEFEKRQNVTKNNNRERER